MKPTRIDTPHVVPRRSKSNWETDSRYYRNQTTLTPQAKTSHAWS